MVVETRSKKNKKIKKVIKHTIPKRKKNLYDWLKKNNLLLTMSQIKELGLKVDNKKVIWHEFVFGCPICKWEKIYALAPEGYHWKEYIEIYKKDDYDMYELVMEKKREKDEKFMEFFRDAICQCFILELDNF